MSGRVCSRAQVDAEAELYKAVYDRGITCITISQVGALVNLKLLMLNYHFKYWPIPLGTALNLVFAAAGAGAVPPHGAAVRFQHRGRVDRAQDREAGRRGGASLGDIWFLTQNGNQAFLRAL